MYLLYSQKIHREQGCGKQTVVRAFNRVNTKPFSLISYVCTGANTCVSSRTSKHLLGRFHHWNISRGTKNLFSNLGTNPVFKTEYFISTKLVGHPTDRLTVPRWEQCCLGNKREKQKDGKNNGTQIQKLNKGDWERNRALAQEQRCRGRKRLFLWLIPHFFPSSPFLFSQLSLRLPLSLISLYLLSSTSKRG